MLEPLDLGVDACQYAGMLIDFLHEQSKIVPVGQVWIGSSEIIESLFGKLKCLEDDESKGGFTSLVLGASDGSDDSVEEAFNALEKSNRVHYIRWDPTLYKSSQKDLDNIEPENISELLELAESCFKNEFTTTKFAPLKTILQHRANTKTD